MFALYVFALVTWQVSWGFLLETDPVPDGSVELTLVDWYGESPYSIKIQQQNTTTQTDEKCQLVLSGVVAALARKRRLGLLTEEQESLALDRFYACSSKLCSNSAMLDAFMRPKTFREQIDLLAATSKVGDILKGKEDRYILLNLLIDGELKHILAGVPLPPQFTGNLAADLSPYTNALREVFQLVCHGMPDVSFIKMAELTEVILLSLSDRYTKNAVTIDDIKSLASLNTSREFSELWDRVTAKIANPTSSFTGSCLDPAVAYFNYEKLSLVRIKKMAKEKDLCVENMESSGIAADYSYAMASPVESAAYVEYAEDAYSTFIEAPSFDFEQSVGMGPPEGGPSSDSGPPSGSSSSSPNAPPGMTGGFAPPPMG